jgi:F-type H+-transporting ATPase subunit gamma
MEDVEALAAHRQVIVRLIPLLEAMRSVAEIAWRRAEQGFQPLAHYSDRLRAMLERVVTSLDREQHAALLGSWADGRPVGLLFVSSERGLCGAFNERLVDHGRQHARNLAAQGQTVKLLCLGSRGRRLLEAAGQPLLYSRSMPSLSVPTYGDVEEVALDLLDLAEQGAFGRLSVIHNAPVQRFQYGVSIQALLPPDITVPEGSQKRAVVKPRGDTPTLITHLLTESLLIGLYQAVMASVISEQLARIYAMRLAVDNARKLLDRLTLEHNLALSHAATSALLEIMAGYEATAKR